MSPSSWHLSNLKTNLVPGSWSLVLPMNNPLAAKAATRESQLAGILSSSGSVVGDTVAVEARMETAVNGVDGVGVDRVEAD